MADRSKDWLNQALRDLNHAKISLEHEDYEWACFASHQAAEKAVKALHLFLNKKHGDMWLLSSYMSFQ